MGLIAPGLIILLLLVSCWSEELATEPWAPITNDMTPQDFYLKNKINGRTWHFRIPKAYLPSESMQARLGGGITHIRTGLPDLKPRKYNFYSKTKKGTVEYEQEQQVWRNGLYIPISGGIRRDDYVDKIMMMIAGNNSILIPSKYPELLEVVGKEQCQKKNSQGGKIEYLCEEDTQINFMTRDKNPKSWRYYSCDVKKNGRGGCKVKTMFLDMQLNYLFRTSEMDRFMEFEKGVQEILSRFYIERYDN